MKHISETRKAKIKIYQKQYYASHKGKKKVYYIAHRKELKEYSANHLEEGRKKSQRYYRRHMTKVKQSHKERMLKKKYNLTLEDYNRMFAAQEGRCKICTKHQSDLKHSLCVDHNHATGEVRGLLCQNCNSVLGQAFENINTLLSAIKYLEKEKRTP